jgi:hypothetical protein
MHNTLTCWSCGKALIVGEDNRDAEAICPACGMSTRDTALQSGEPTPHADSTAVQAEAPMPRAVSDVDTTRDVDIHLWSWSRLLIVLIVILGLMLVFCVGGYYFSGQ